MTFWRLSIRFYRTTLLPYAGIGFHIHWRFKGQEAESREGKREAQ